VVTAGNAPAASRLPGEGAGDGARVVAPPSEGEHFGMKVDRRSSSLCVGRWARTDERLTNGLGHRQSPRWCLCGIPSTWRSPTTRHPGRAAFQPAWRLILSCLRPGCRVVALWEVDGMAHPA
jgi:hypothetical protein